MHVRYSGPLVIGLDVGSTTVKAVAVEPSSLRILWSDYRRHQTRQPERLLEQLEALERALPDSPREGWRVFITGSGAGPLAAPLGAKFVQEVNAVSLAVEALHPDAGSAIELGGQDAKIILFYRGESGERTAAPSMNDKCASGTGATIDKCMIKVGLPAGEVVRLHFDDSKLHPVAAKCGVFAETDVVNLVKAGIPAAEIACSLADAIVLQNLSVLTRGSTLKDQVILLGGPNTYLPFLQECWKKRIPETWRERGHAPKLPLEQAIVVPENAQLYAAIGACVYGLGQPEEVGRYAGRQGLLEYSTHGRKARLGASAGAPLAKSAAEVEAFRERYRIPPFAPRLLRPGQVVRAAIGVDGGSTSSKAVLLDESGEVVCKAYQLSKGNPIADAQELLAKLRAHVTSAGAELEVLGFGATGYAADVLEECLGADVNVVETVAHMESAVRYFGDVDVICDIGGQDIKVLFMKGGDIAHFRLSNSCSAGNGMLLQAMADQFGLEVSEYADAAFKAELAPKFSYGCAVFLDTDRVSFQREGFSKEELLAGLAQVLPKNVWQYVVQVPRLSALGRRFVLQGGTQYNLAAVKAQVDYIEARVPGAEVFVHPHCGEAGALGAALETLRVVKREGRSRFIGLDAALGLQYSTRNDASTACPFCANHCKRTFVDARRPDGSTARSIAGFSCEKGAVESADAVRRILAEKRELARRSPNLLEYEARRAFAHFHEPEPMPPAGAPVEDVEVRRGLFGIRRVPRTRPFERSSGEARARRERLRIGIPRVLNLYSTAPYFRAYFEALGIAQEHVVFSDATSEDLWTEGGKYGSVDPCFPSKVAQAHLHNLLFRHHEPNGKRGPLHYVFFPIITHLQNPLRRTGDNASCPLVAGTPEVVKAAFTKEIDFFAQRGIEYLNTPVTFDEPNLLSERMFEAWGMLLGVTRDESDHAHRQGLDALAAFDRDLQDKGRAVLSAVEAERRLALLVLGRPYHSDPGLNHGIPEEFQAMGYPILSVRSLPRDPEFLARFFPEEIARGQDPLDIADVWPENYSANSAQKVWAAKLGARHPNIALLDFSSFKCGHDAPTYGIIDAIVAAAGAPYAALHDLDANKPGSSLKIRVKTYHHTLKLRQESLEDAARRERELALSLARKRLELLARRQAELEGRVQDPTLAAQAETESLAASVAAQRAPERPGRGGAPSGLALHRRPAAQTEAKEVA